MAVERSLVEVRIGFAIGTRVRARFDLVVGSSCGCSLAVVRIAAAVAVAVLLLLSCCKRSFYKDAITLASWGSWRIVLVWE